MYGVYSYGFQLVRDFAKEVTLLGDAKHLREGVVVKPLIERHDGRIVLKYISDDYLLAKHSDFAEV
jgi:hypothetical protein